MGTRATTEALNRLEGMTACVATIGPAGENLVPYACMLNSRNHSAGAGLGTIMGSKKLKALVVQGNGSVYVADPQEVADLSDYMLREVIDSNNNHVVPSTQQAWAEYYDKGIPLDRSEGSVLGARRRRPIETGEPKPGEAEHRRLPLHEVLQDEGPEAEKYTIKMNGCHSCPIHCYSDMRVPAAKDHGGFEITGNTCVPNFPFTSNYMCGILKGITPVEKGSEDALIWDQVIGSTVDDLGLWCTTPSSTATSRTASRPASSSAFFPPRSTRCSTGTSSRTTTRPSCPSYSSTSHRARARCPTSPTAPSCGASAGTTWAGSTRRRRA